MNKIFWCLISLVIVLVANLLFSDIAGAGPITSLPVEQTEVMLGDPAVPAQIESPHRAKIPEYPVHMYIKRGQHSRFELFFLDVKYDYDLVDFETYKAWCLQKSKRMRRNAMHQVRLYNCYDPNIPEQFRGTDWNRINYIINHKKGSKEAIQEAIWALSDKANRPESEETAQLLEESAQKGKEFRPADGELLAIICYPEGKQPVLIEYLLPQTETFDVAPAFFEPALAALPAATAPGLLPLVPLLIVPIIPFIPPDFPPIGPPTPPTPPSVPEPSSLFLMGSGLAFMVMLKAIAGHRKQKTSLSAMGDGL